MHGIYYYLQPAFLLLLVLAGAAALYLGVFKAQRPGRRAGTRALCGVLSGVLSAAFWIVLYSHQYLGW